MEDERLQVTCRTAQAADKPDVLDLTRTIWDGDDYVPYVWDDWLADPSGRLVVAEHAGKVIGLGKLTQLGPQDWWLEGLRVDPAFEGRGVASQLHEELVATWERAGSGTLRLMTSSKRIPVHRMCLRLGFSKVGEFAFLIAPSQVQPEETPGMPDLPFQPVLPEQAGEAADYALHNPIQDLTGQLIDLSWQMARPQVEFLRQAAQEGRAWWWRGRQGLLVYNEDREDPADSPRLAVALLACSREGIQPLLLDFRRLAYQHGSQEVFWLAPLHPQLLPYLEAAGFSQAEEHRLFIFAKEK